jgi:hypothetical protein
VNVVDVVACDPARPNLTKRNIVIFDGRGRPLERVPPGRTRVWADPRIGAREPPPEREGLIRYWRIPGTADGERFEIVGFLGYRPPARAASESDGLPTWAIIAAGACRLCGPRNECATSFLSLFAGFPSAGQKAWRRSALDGARP